MAAVLLCQGQGGRNKANKTKSCWEPLSCLHRASPVSSQVCYSHMGAAVGSFPCPWGFVKGGFC